MNLTNLSVKRPVTIVMITLIIILLGVVSLTRLPIDLLPEFSLPVAIVQTSYSGVGPQEIENLVTRPIEESIGTVSNIKNVSSISSEGSSIIIAEFNFGTDMDFASLEMREKVDMVKGLLPEGSNDPMVLKMDPNAMPIVQASLSGSEDLAALQTFAEDELSPRLERIDGVASVDISGGYEREVRVQVDQQKIQNYGLSMDNLAQLIGAENLSLPGGSVEKGIQNLTIRTTGEFEEIDEIRSLPISLPTGGTILLADVADVSIENKDVSSISKINGNPSISISIQKQSGTNTVSVAKKVNEEIENIKEEYPTRDLTTVIDQSDFINLAINAVVKSGFLGAILAVIILFLFLRNIRTTLIVGVAIPVSIIATFSLIYFNNITLNLMTLGGLALGIGMLVDNSIVVLENIYRYRQEGLSKVESAIKGTKEVGMAVTASTLTTVAVFLPIVFVEGITSTIFKELALTVTFSLLASLIVALTLVPMLSSQILKVDNNQGKRHKQKFRLISFIFDGFDKVFSKVEKVYKRILLWSLGHRKSTILISILVFIVSIVSLTQVGAEFIPATDEGQFTVSVELPTGSELDRTNDIVLEIEEKLSEIEVIDTIFTTVGSGGQMSMGGNTENQASITGVLNSNRQETTFEVAEEAREKLKDIPGADINVEVTSNSMGMSGMTGSPVSIEIKGDDLDTLGEISEDFIEIVKSVEGTREVSSSIGEGTPEVQINIDKVSASQYGLSTAQIANTVQTVVSGQTATRYTTEGDEIDLVVQGDDIYSQSISNLRNLPINTPMGTVISLEQVADVEIVEGPIAINRDAQSRIVTVSSNISGRDLGSVVNDIEEKLNEYDMESGYSYEIGGENEQLEEAFSDLGLALILAVILVYMILASQFESLLNPFIIMFTVPLSIAGGALGLFLTGRTLNVTSLIGAIMLIGIVVNNAIVLIDYINTRRRNGENRLEAIKNAGPIRLRPILMTTLTTVLGLLPIAIGLGEGSEIQAPMATVVIGGLLLSTLLTLVLIPVMYTIFDDISRKLRRGDDSHVS
ncbi:efflux RND transporter permease subunit [Clostridium sp. D2Q-14]|uniref:efflux RND transporter permease subunit n=1 Tax=Anaeromonas gelatinilytica TaxID=2683194 RepID=UPI00193B1838|nr:efflux RND transporter permease subunit [Anaeromonas gelatinilytica]MBS4534922.1 efflux RND transporter permease subunit [Anaeromonas gelatinilytica]